MEIGQGDTFLSEQKELSQLMELEQLRKVIEKKETMKVEFKTTPLLKPSKRNRSEIACQLVAFANRNGGYLIFGIKDDGTFEGAKINEDKEVQKISYIARDKCSPQIVFTHQFFETDEGDVLVIEIERRKGMPHAVVERVNHEIRKRVHYIRTSKGKRLVDDKTLEWLFSYKEPKLSSRFQFFVTYNRKTLGLPPFECPTSFWNFVPFFNALSEKDRKYLLEDESSRIGSFVVEIAPFAMLQYFAYLFWNSWQVDIFRVKGIRRTRPVKTAIKGREIKLSDIPIPQQSFISNLSVDSKKIMEKPVGKIVVPPDTEIVVQFSEPKEKFTQSLLRIHKEKVFSIETRFFASQWIVGLPIPSPLRYKHQRIDVPDDRRKEFEEFIATTTIDITFNADFEFPDVNDPLFNEQFEYAKVILDQLECDWNWDRFLTHLPHGKLYSIEDKIDEILLRLRKSG